MTYGERQAAKEAAIAAIRVLFDKATGLEDLAGEVIATLRLNFDKGSLAANYPNGREDFDRIITRWQDKFKELTQ